MSLISDIFSYILVDSCVAFLLPSLFNHEIMYASQFFLLRIYSIYDETPQVYLIMLILFWELLYR